ncbi:hypothetical protein IAR50_000976 [Cryptococcus sp. DSM 104548]
MKWMPSCKNGGEKWAYDGFVPHPDVFYRAFGIEKPKKEWKVKTIPVEDFTKTVGHISASVRYDSLRVTRNVSVTFSEDLTYKLSGTYGVGY